MKRLQIACVVVLVALAGVCAWKGFAKWNLQRLVSAATAHYQKGDYASAALSAKQALRSDPGNLPAHIVLARIARIQNSPEVILWQQKVVDLQPGKAEPLLELASTATALGESFIAERALNQVSPQEQGTLAFHQTVVAWAIATRQYGLAEQHLQQALKLEPKSEVIEMNIATVHLLSTNQTVAADAQATLERLQNSADPKITQAATRALFNAARVRQDRGLALELATKLQQSADCSVQDRLSYMEELQNAGKPEFEQKLQAMQERAARLPETAYLLMTWMNANGLAAKSIQWGARLPVNYSSQIPVCLSLAEANASLEQWEDLRKLLLRSHWGPLGFLADAIQARILEKDVTQGRGADFRLKWDRAIAATDGDPNSLAMLARLVDGWGWKKESAQVWWYIAQRKTGQRPALRALYRMYSEEKNTAELYRVARRIAQVEPGNPVAKNNVAMLALLLGKDLPEAHRLAEENSRVYPKESAFVSTRALSLHIQNRSKEALALLQQLPETALQEPSLAACYGAILSATGDREKAAPFLKLAVANRSELFPEEAVLAEKALNPQG